MIVYELICSNEHSFEAWFQDSAAYDKQRKQRKVRCPVCDDAKISKALMAPAVAGAKKKDKQPHSMGQGAYMNALRELRRHVEANCDNVGDRFPEEARKIHYGETEKRNIYGDATKEEAEALGEEGIECQRIPWVPPHDA